MEARVAGSDNRIVSPVSTELAEGAAIMKRRSTIRARRPRRLHERFLTGRATIIAVLVVVAVLGAGTWFAGDPVDADIAIPDPNRVGPLK